MASNDRNAAVGGGSGVAGTPANIGGDASNRRGSQGGTLFSGLMNQKRNSGDATATARRESFNDMKPQAGVLGKMWNNFTSGSPPKGK